MSLYKSLFKQTTLYGLATVLPRMLSFFLVRLYTDTLENASDYGVVTIIFAWLVFMNVVLSYGMETSFFRFYNAEQNKQKVIQTSSISIFWSTIGFLVLALLFRNNISDLIGVELQYVTYGIWILALDALVVIPFSKLRIDQRPLAYAAIKLGNTAITLLLNIFFLVFLPELIQANPDSVFSVIYIEGFQIGYIFVSNLIASMLTLLYFMPLYLNIKWQFDKALWRRMMKYSLPILVAGIAFAINEHFDKILLEWLLPDNIAKHEVGVYGACYKLGLFMVLFATAFRLGIEPFFFSYADNENAPKIYAIITKYFVIFGSLILLSVIVFADVLKRMLINADYWEAMKVVPLIILANFFLGIYHNLSIWYKLTDRTKMGAYISIIGAVLTLALNFALIPKYSYMGSAIATLAAYGTMMLISYFLGKKYYHIPYDIKRIGAYLGSSVVFSGVYFYLFRENYSIGIGLMLLFALLIYYLEKDTLKTILKRKHAN
ncbi:MAG TPA: polysaccharide biosynthesis C-terminal domain-containing protein [Flavobacterium sp.]|nr:polysaccharide biosynthesis C-terminal domain-containing protein [Flavobacterium sp.]